MNPIRPSLLFALVAVMVICVGYFQSWNLAFAIVNLGLISAIMTLGINIQWGYAGLVNFGTMGFIALGGLAGVLVSMPPIPGAWAAGGTGILAALVAGIGGIIATIITWRWTAKMGRRRYYIMAAIVLAAVIIFRMILDPAVAAIEQFESAKSGYLGGFGLPILISWGVGGVLAAAVAWVIGKISLGLRSDYLAIATLGISEIIIFAMKNEDWLTRGVKNVSGMPRPVPYEIDLQQWPALIEFTERWGLPLVDSSSIIVKLCYGGLFAVVLAVVYTLSEIALRSPWGRMMNAIRDNEIAAEAMGKDVKTRHLQVFIIGSAVIGIAGAMLTTLDGQLTPSSYHPLRFTFLIWVMVILGGSGNNLGAIIGGFLVWFFWVEAEPVGLALIEALTFALADDNLLKIHLIESAAHTRHVTMGLILILVLRFAPKGLIPEIKR
jgi:branched-chain amino acid transport system permease protein